MGATFRVVDGVSLFAGYSEGFQGVVGGAFYGLDPQAGNLAGVGRRLQVQAAPIKGLTGTAALYQVTRQNVLTAIPNTFFFSQDGEQRARGAELDLIYEPMPAVSILFNYAYTDAKVTKGHHDPRGRPAARGPQALGTACGALPRP